MKQLPEVTNSTANLKVNPSTTLTRPQSVCGPKETNGSEFGAFPEGIGRETQISDTAGI